MRLICVLLFFFLNDLAKADLYWPLTTKSFTSFVGASDVEIKFAFTNVGKQPIKFVRFEPTCPCLYSDIPTTAYNPGDSGVFSIWCRVGSKSGSYVQSAKIFAHGYREAIGILEVRFAIQDVATVSPAIVSWNVGDKVGRKIAIIEPAEGLEIKNLNIVSANEAFSCVLKRNRQGAGYLLEVSPIVTDRKNGELIIVKMDFFDRPPSELSIIALIR